MSFRVQLKVGSAAVGLNGPGGISHGLLVKTIFERFFSVANNDAQPYSNPVAFNYQQLLNQTDDAKSTRYDPEQYRRAVQNPSMRTHLYHLCVKHPSEWYYSSEAPIWKSFLSPEMKTESPEWYAYSVKYLTDIRWMHRVAEMVENPWHLHPLVFLYAITARRRKTVNRPKNVQDFVDMALPSAKATSDKWRVPVSVLLAQSALESGWGQKVKNNAYFGIKGRSSSSGNSASFGTTEYENGHYVSKVQTFRAYNDYSESADDYGLFLAENRRYRPAFEYVTQPEKFVHEVAAAGYATDPTYESKLIKIMRSYDFYEYD